MRTLLCDIETMELVDHNPPIVRHFAQANSNQAPSTSAQAAVNPAAPSPLHHQYGSNGSASHHTGHHHPSAASQVVSLSQAVETPPSQFLPSMTSLAFHPYFPILAFGGPDLLGNVSMVRLEQQNRHHHTFHRSSQALSGLNILDSDEQRHIPSLNRSDTSTKTKSLFRF
jgi:hypothetical protein